MHYFVMRIWKTRRFPVICALIFAVGTAIIWFVGRQSHAASTGAFSARSPLLVIDAGHGGLDGGAVSVTGVRESRINLDIAQRLFDLCRFMGCRCSMTRTSEDLAYPEAAETVRDKKRWDLQRRVEQIDSDEDSVFISIHQNNYPDARPSGSQVLFARSDGSAVFAALTHDLLRQHLCPENRRVASPATDSIYILKEAKCPAILVECGFLSNEAEARKLISAPYQTRIAAILGASCIQFITPAI